MKIKDRVEFKSKPPVLSFAETDTVIDAVRAMSEKNYGASVVVDSDNRPVGIVTERDFMRRLLAKGLDANTTPLGDIMTRDLKLASPEDAVVDWLRIMSNERFRHLPVIDAQGKLIGRVTVDTVLDFIRDEAEAGQLAQAGLREEEDIFASVWDSVKNRWAWLAITLVTAFIASRVIGAFEGSIEKLVALAALMPIVAGIGGNSGNQTIIMIVRAIALGQVSPDHARRLYRKEMGVAVINGLLWGGLLGLLSWWLYSSMALGLVMTAAMTLNLMLAATLGVAVPMTLQKHGRDPAMGASVLITAVTDSGGFLIFLGLATLILL